MSVQIEKAASVIRGAAVIVDDKIGNPEGALAEILRQLEDAAVPVVRMQELPRVESLVHWRQFGLIVLDWELTYSELDEPVEEFGITVPSGLQEGKYAEVTEFVRALLSETMLPIFIASSGDVEGIRQHLDDALTDLGAGNRARVRVYSKTTLEFSLFDELEKSISDRPSVNVLRAWGRAYLDAEMSTFRHFVDSDEDWVMAMVKAARDDQSAVDHVLRETIARNIVNRIQPIAVELPDSPSEAMGDASSLRRVVHLSAVVPAEALKGADLASGDLFVAESDTEPYSEIRILMTPDCDLVRRTRVRFLYLTAVLHLANQNKNAVNRVKELRARRPESFLTAVLTPSGTEYKVALKDWESEWVELSETTDADMDTAWPGHRRIGRLMDPYISNVQQHFASEAIRKGLPRIPDDFFEGWATPDPGA